jgi:hypothetical protein
VTSGPKPFSLLDLGKELSRLLSVPPAVHDTNPNPLLRGPPIRLAFQTTRLTARATDTPRYEITLRT